MTRARSERSSIAMSRHSTVASRSMLASIRSASRRRYGPRPAGPSAAQAGKASAATATAVSTSASPARATSASTLSSMGERSSNRSSLATLRPPIQWSGETAMPATVLTPPPGDHVTHLVAFHGRHAVVAVGGRRKAGRPPTCVERVARSALEEVGYLVALLPLRHRLEVVDRVGEREAEARADAGRGQGGVLLARRVEELERRRPLADLRDRAVAALCAHQLVHGRVVVAAGGEAGEVAPVHQRRVVVLGPGLRDALRRDRALGDQPAVRRAHPGERPPLGPAVEP